MSFDSLDGKYKDSVKSDEEVLREGFGHMPLQHQEGYLTEPSKHDVHIGPKAEELPGKTHQFDLSRRTYDREDDHGLDALAMELHNNRAFQAFFQKLAIKTERYRTKTEELLGENHVPVHHPDSELTQLRDGIADDIEKEVYNELASRGAENRTVGPEDVKQVLAGKTVEYHKDVSRIESPWDADLEDLLEGETFNRTPGIDQSEVEKYLPSNEEPIEDLTDYIS
jgi:hypothetical protein